MNHKHACIKTFAVMLLLLCAVLPAMGYGAAQTADLQQTIANTPADMVLIATPIDLARVVAIDKPHQRVRYELQEIGRPTLVDLLAAHPRLRR